MNLITRFRKWRAGPIADERTRKEARRIRNRRDMVRGSQADIVAGPGVVQPPPTSDVVDPRR